MPLSIETLAYGGGVLLLLVLVTLVLLVQLRSRFQRLLGASLPNSHAEMLTQVLHRSDIAEKEISALQSRIEVLEAIGSRSFQKVGFLRFNPFSDTGGDQSFCLALLDHEDNGIVISSLYNRDGTRVYAKAIEHGQSKNQLSEEEAEVLKRATAK